MVALDDFILRRILLTYAAAFAQYWTLTDTTAWSLAILPTLGDSATMLYR